MKNNRKGFSLIELIAVIVILSLVLTIAAPAVSRLLSKNKKAAYEGKLDIIFKQAKQYARDNESFLYGTAGTYNRYVCNTITVGQLKTAGYLEELKEDGEATTINDPRTNTSMENKVIMVYIKSNSSATGDEIYKGNLVATDQNTSRCSTANISYSATGKEEVFTASQTGTYKIEAWGAQGGSYNSTYRGGYGAYAYGEIELNVGDKLYINVGGEGKKTSQANQMVSGGYNGGGVALNDCAYDDNIAGSGGGATTVSLKSGLLKTLSNDVDKIILVAAGGGGAYYCPDPYNRYQGYGGNGGATQGLDGSSREWDASSGKGASQTAAGCRSNNTVCSKFGVANEPGDPLPSSGGGSGFYAGAGGYRAGAGGGSSYIANSRLSNKGMYCESCYANSETNTRTWTGNCVSKNPESNCSKKGGGYVKITYIGTPSSPAENKFISIPGYRTYYAHGTAYEWLGIKNDEGTYAEYHDKYLSLPSGSRRNVYTQPVDLSLYNTVIFKKTKGIDAWRNMFTLNPTRSELTAAISVTWESIGNDVYIADISGQTRDDLHFVISSYSQWCYNCGDVYYIGFSTKTTDEVKADNNFLTIINNP